MLKRINAEIEARRRAGEDLPPAPKTAIAGPEYFGFNQPEVPRRPVVGHCVMHSSQHAETPHVPHPSALACMHSFPCMSRSQTG